MPRSSLAIVRINESAGWAEDHRIVGREDQVPIPQSLLGFETGHSFTPYNLRHSEWTLLDLGPFYVVGINIPHS